jgi:hypothetical protein
MDNNIVKKFKTIINQQIALQIQLKNMNANMFAAISKKDLQKIKILSDEIDFTVEQMDTLERDRIDLLLPYFSDKNRLKHINSFIDEFPKEDIPAIKKLHSELKEKSIANFEQSKFNEILLNEAVLDIRRNIEIIVGQVNRPIKYGVGGQMQASLPVHVVNQKI